jgi:hypothetical protein
MTNNLLDVALNGVFEVIRQQESDNDELEYNIDEDVIYIFHSILDRLYTYDDNATRHALGLLEEIKLSFSEEHVNMRINQRIFDKHQES